MNDKDLVQRPEGCCGCTACMSVCPKNAISMTADSEGFLYPTIDETKCIDCGACKRVCAFHDKYKTPNLMDEIEIYAAKHKDIDERLTSRSGGVFMALSEYVLQLEGVVYGASLNDKLEVAHARISEKKDLYRLKGSKYVQSNMNDMLSNVKNDLLLGKYVLFSGTACQIAGVISYIPEKLQEKLITCDIICHGVPSPKIWKDYILWVEKNEHKKVIDVNFRDKSFGWNSHCETLYFNEDKTDKLSTKTYSNLFTWAIMLRPSCSECHFTNYRRVSDFTIGDFWGIDKIAPEFNDNKGVSLFFVNTEKAKKIFESISSSIDYIESTKEACVQPNLIGPTKFARNRKQFWRDYYNHGFDHCITKYNGIVQRLYRKVNKYLEK